MDPKLSASVIQDVLKGLEGEIYNVPPVESAVKVRVRTMTIHEIQLLESDEEAGIVLHPDLRLRRHLHQDHRPRHRFAIGPECKLMELHRSRTGVFTKDALQHAAADLMQLCSQNRARMLL